MVWKARLCLSADLQVFGCPFVMRILTRKQLLELIQFGNWHPYLSRITWDKWQQLYHVTQSEQRISGSCHYWRASKGGVRHKGLYALAQPAPDSSELHILLSAPTEYFCRGNVYAQEEHAFQSLWNLQKLKYTYISCTNYPACTLRRKYAVWKLQFLVSPCQWGDLLGKSDIQDSKDHLQGITSENCTGIISSQSSL